MRGISLTPLFQKNYFQMDKGAVNNNPLSGYRPTLFIRCLLFSTFIITMSSFRIASLNLNRVRDIKKRSLLYEVRKTKQIAIAFTQETHNSKNIEVKWQREWGGQVVFSHLRSALRELQYFFGVCFYQLLLSMKKLLRADS